MATREENIKKINDELEQLSDEELEQVAGGGWIDCKIPNTDNDSNPLDVKDSIGVNVLRTLLE
ncbi:MAG: hypothetical protein IKZ58_10410 [Selenomonadaceae bacterium]|nr:hypothetical protein [Selenomonadaceae bacterium]